jgi:hypothetical protein
MFHLILVVGEPCSGKTTFMRRFLPTLKDLYLPMRYKEVWGNWYDAETGLALVFGVNKPGVWGGTDTLARHTHPQFMEYAATLVQQPRTVVGIAEGNLWANNRFVADALATGVHVSKLALLVPPEVLAARQAARSTITGKVQNPVWLRGRHTHIERFIHAAPEATCIEHVGPEDTEVAVAVLGAIMRMPLGAAK